MKTMTRAKDEKVTLRQDIKTSMEETQTNYTSIKQDLDSYNDSVFEIECEAKDVNSQLIDIEILHCIKTSPENLDEIRDRPQSVKIARSLRDKITSKRLRKSQQ